MVASLLAAPVAAVSAVAVISPVSGSTITCAVNPWSQLRSSHPTSEQRIKALQTATTARGPDGGCVRDADVHIAGPLFAGRGGVS
jgi:hypothetical protein